MAVTPHTYALTTLATVKEHINIPGANVDFDDILQRFINATTERMENMTGRLLGKRTFTEYQDGRSNDRTTTNQWPAIKPTEVWIDNDSLFTDATTQLALADYELELDATGAGFGIVLLDGRVFDRGTRNVKLVYEAGYDPIPDDLELAAIFMAEYFYDVRSDRRIGTESKGKNQENTRFLQDYPTFVLEIIDRYKRFEFATANVAVQNR